MPSRCFIRVILSAAALPVVGCLSPAVQEQVTARPTEPTKGAVLDVQSEPAEIDVSRQQEVIEPAAEVARVRPAAVDPGVEALRRRSEAYARELEPLLPENSDFAEEPQPARQSAVKWLDPAKYQVFLGDRPVQRKVARVESAALPQQAPKTAPSPTQPPPPAVKAPDAVAATPSDDSNTPLALADVRDEPETVAVVTPPRPLVQPDRNPISEITTPEPPNAGALASRLARRVKENPKDVSSHLEYQLLLFLMDEQVPNLASIATLPQEDRELVTAVLDGVSNLRATLRRDANLLIAEKIRPLVELSDRLRTSAELRVPTIALCDRVEGFGRFDAVEPRFIAGRESQTIVYCEIENFSSQYQQQQWETNLSMELSLFTEMGQQVYIEQPAAIADTSKSRRHDFFLRKLIKLPSNLTIGRYVLKVTIVDTQSNRVAETSLPLQIVAQ